MGNDARFAASLSIDCVGSALFFFFSFLRRGAQNTQLVRRARRGSVSLLVQDAGAALTRRLENQDGARDVYRLALVRAAGCLLLDGRRRPKSAVRRSLGAARFPRRLLFLLLLLFLAFPWNLLPSLSAPESNARVFTDSSTGCEPISGRLSRPVGASGPRRRGRSSPSCRRVGISSRSIPSGWSGTAQSRCSPSSDAPSPHEKDPHIKFKVQVEHMCVPCIYTPGHQTR